ncbi:MAG: rhomboid protease GluP [bacterium]|jgi:rhomboid protease GluP
MNQEQEVYIPPKPLSKLIKAIIAVNTLFFIFSYLVPFILPDELSQPLRKGMFGLLPSPSSLSLKLLGWADLGAVQRGDWWVLITAIFLHGGVLHIIFNLLWVKDLGSVAEDIFTPSKMLFIYVLSGIFGNVVAVYTPSVLNELFSTNIRPVSVVGASGSVFGLLGSLIGFGFKRGGDIGTAIIKQFGKWAILLIGIGFLFPNVSNSAHVGGCLAGIVLGYIVPFKEPSYSYQEKKRQPAILGIVTAGVCLFSFLMMATRFYEILQEINQQF